MKMKTQHTFIHREKEEIKHGRLRARASKPCKHQEREKESGKNNMPMEWSMEYVCDKRV